MDFHQVFGEMRADQLLDVEAFFQRTRRLSRQTLFAPSTQVRKDEVAAFGLHNSKLGMADI